MSSAATVGSVQVVQERSLHDAGSKAVARQHLLTHLPPDVNSRVLSFCGAWDLTRLAAVSKGLRLDLAPSLFSICSAVRGFEKDGAGSLAALQSLGLVGTSPAQIADFLYDSKGRIPARQVGRFLTLWYANSSGRGDGGIAGHLGAAGDGAGAGIDGDGEETEADRARVAALVARVRAEKAQCKAIMRAFLRRLDFSDDTPVQALRRLLARTRMPMESRSAGALLKRFSERYVECQRRAARRGTADGAPDYRFGPASPASPLTMPPSPSPSPSPSPMLPASAVTPAASPRSSAAVSVSAAATTSAAAAAPAVSTVSASAAAGGGSSRSLLGLRAAALTVQTGPAQAAAAAVAASAARDPLPAGSTGEPHGASAAAKLRGAGASAGAASPTASAASGGAAAAGGAGCSRASLDEGCISDADADADGFAGIGAGSGSDADGCARAQRRVLYGCNVAELGVETMFMVTYTIVILNTDMRHAGIKTKMTREQFARKNRSVPGLEAIPDSFWCGLFDELAVRGLPVADAVPTAPVRHALAGAGPDPQAVSALRQLSVAARPTSATISAAHAAAAAEAAASAGGVAHLAPARISGIGNAGAAAPGSSTSAPSAAVVRERANSAFRWVKASLAAAGSAVSSAAAAALPVAAAATSNLRSRSRSWFTTVDAGQQSTAAAPTRAGREEDRMDIVGSPSVAAADSSRAEAEVTSPPSAAPAESRQAEAGVASAESE